MAMVQRSIQKRPSGVGNRIQSVAREHPFDLTFREAPTISNKRSKQGQVR